MEELARELNGQRLLVVSPDEELRQSIVDNFSDQLIVRGAPDADALPKTFSLDSYAFVLVDEQTPQPGQARLLKDAKAYLSPRSIILLTASEKGGNYYGVEYCYVPRGGDSEWNFLKSIIRAVRREPDFHSGREHSRPAFNKAYDLRHRLLVVDGDAHHCAAMQKLFASTLEVVTAASVTEAKEKYDLDLVDVALIDWHFSGESGLTLARNLAFYLPANRIIVHTADDTISAQANPTFSTLSKNCASASLADRVHATLQGVEPQRVRLGNVMGWLDQENEADKSAVKRPRMLVVASDENSRRMLRELFAQKYQLSVATSAEDAKDRYPLDTFDLAFVEDELPGVRGLDFIRSLTDYLPEKRLWLYTGDLFIGLYQTDGEYFHLSKSTPPEVIARYIANNVCGEQGVALPQGWFDKSQREKTDPNDKRPRLLVVDDEADQCTAIKDMFSGKMSVATATSVQEALKKFDLQSFAVAVIDWHMPGESGIVLARMLRSCMPERCILLHSADDSAVNYQSGSFVFVPKKIAPEDFETMVYAAAASRVKAKKFA